MAHPRMYDDSHPALHRLREICLALPEAFEKEAWGECTFRVQGGSMFAMTDCNHHGSRHIAVWVKSPKEVQEIMVGADPKRFFVPPYMGHKGWIGVRLDYKVDWIELAEIVKDGYSMSVPKRLLTSAKAEVKASSSRPAKKRSKRALQSVAKPATRPRRTSKSGK